MKIVQLITKRRKLSAQQITKLFKGVLLSILLKKVLKKLKIVQQITKRMKLSAQQITKLFKGFLLSILLLKSVKEIENSSADYQTKEIICSTGCKNI